MFQIVCTISGELVDSTLCLPPTNEVCEGYVFTGVSLSTGWGLYPGGGSLTGGSLSRGGFLLGRPPPRTVTCGRYASYWNAFLFISANSSVTCRMHRTHPACPKIGNGFCFLFTGLFFCTWGNTRFSSQFSWFSTWVVFIRGFVSFLPVVIFLLLTAVLCNLFSVTAFTGRLVTLL